MYGFIINLTVLTIATMITESVLTGVHFVGSPYVAAIATAFALICVNKLAKPILKLVSLPLNLLTLGSFDFILNAVCLECASYCSRNILHTGITIDSFFIAIIAAIVLSLASTLVSFVVKVEGGK